MDKEDDSSESEEGRPSIKLDNKRVSAILKAFLENFSKQRVTVGDLTNALADRAFAILMLVFALPNLVPFPLPGISVILGTPLLLLSFQLMMGRKAPWFPQWLSKRSFRRNDMESVVSYAMPYLKKVERVLKPRLSFLLNPSIEKIIALICIVMAVMITLPIPLGNWFPAFTICLFSIAILERDGLFILLGCFAAIVSTALVGTVLLTVLEAVLFFLEKAFV
jgi:hypothetical protein